ncbi:MAG: hypothetical protein H6633_17770 [Anaerolineales bacterium]|nr:hypothetical protein [Anaerolineales bacterium]
MLDHFPRPPHDNGRGVHWSPSQYAWGQDNWSFWKDQLQAMNIKWVKLLDDGGGSAMGLVKRLIDIEIMPVVRYYREEPNPGRISAREIETSKRYADIGAVYFETNNEPDLALEWEERKRPPNWLDIVVDNFIIEADMIRRVGGYLLFPAFGPGGRGNPFKMIVERGRRDLLDGNCCLAIHNYGLGRPLDYPNDTINTQGVPLAFETWEDRGGLWAWEMDYKTVNQHRQRLANPNASIMEDSTGFRAFEYFDVLINEAVGHSIPIFTTEGGYNVGQRAGTTFGDDPRYPKPTPNWTGRLTDDMFRYLEEQAPDYYFACMPWLIAVRRMGVFSEGFENQGPWFTHHFDKQFGLNGVLPVVSMLSSRPGKVRQDGPVPQGMRTFYTGPDLTGRNFDDRFKYLEPQVLLEPVADPTQPHWRLIAAEWADEREAQGRAYIYAKALDESGQPLENVTFQADRGDAIDKAQTKGPIDHYWGNVMMTGLLGTYKVSMAQDNLPSDRLVNVGLGNEVSPQSFVRTSFFLTFQKVAGHTGGTPTPQPKPILPPEPEPVPTPELKPTPEPEPTPTPEPEPTPTPEPEPEPEPVPEPRPELPERKLDPRLDSLTPAVTVIPVADATQPHWRLIRVRWADKQEAQNRGYIYLKALDEAGRPIEGALFQADRGDAIDKALTKGAVDHYLGNYMMTGKLGTYTVSMSQDDMLSDKLANVGLGEPGAPWDRTAFFLVFQKIPGQPKPALAPVPAAMAAPPPPEPISPTPSELDPLPGPQSIAGPRAADPAERVNNAENLSAALLLASSEYVIPVNRASALYQYAQTKSLGQYLSAEFPIQYKGVDYRAQVFERGIVYVRLDRSGVVKVIAHSLYREETRPTKKVESSPQSESLLQRWLRVFGLG